MIIYFISCSIQLLNFSCTSLYCSVPNFFMNLRLRNFHNKPRFSVNRGFNNEFMNLNHLSNNCNNSKRNFHNKPRFSVNQGFNNESMNLNHLSNNCNNSNLPPPPPKWMLLAKLIFYLF